jgi:leader peptidase (prepilin peptidase) / N-methyltransferase
MGSRGSRSRGYGAGALLVPVALDATALAAAAAFAVLGGAWGFVADRVSAHWPAHEGGRVRPVDWRTAIVAIAGAAASSLLPGRFGDVRDLVIVAGWFALLLVLMATDLDQRLLPDEITLPLIPVALVILLVGWDPLLADKDLGVASGVAAAIAAPLFLGVTGVVFRGALGIGDLKLAVSLGMFAGLSNLAAGFVVATFAASIVIISLLLSRRIRMRSVIPFGPILIVAAFCAVAVPVR